MTASLSVQRLARKFPALSGVSLAVLALALVPGTRLAAQDSRPQVERSRGPRPVMVKVPYVGLRSEEAPEALSHHLPIPRGFGLLVTEVVKESPAADAGIQRYDVLLRCGDQRLANSGQLNALVRARKPGETMRLTVFRAGKEWDVNLILWETEEPEGTVGEPPGAARGRSGRQLRQPTERVRRPEGPEMDLSAGAAFSRELLEKTERMGDEALRKFREIEPFQFLQPPSQPGVQAAPERAVPK
jgi:hypothetical protein